MLGSEGSLQDGPGAEAAKVALPPMRLRLHRDSDENFRDTLCRRKRFPQPTRVSLHLGARLPLPEDGQ